MVIDRWFIPALAISIFFLIVYGLYQVLVMPRLIASLALIIVTLAAMFVILLMLYVNHFETFCYFITRTALGHTISIVLIITLLFVCGIVNIFSCPPYKINVICHDIFYSITSCVLWMFATTVFIRYISLCHLLTLFLGIGVYCIQMFLTHSDLYIHYSILVEWRIEYDLLIALITFALIIYFQARRNEKIIRLDFLSLLRSMEEACQLERYVRINEQILINALPHHIAYNFLHRSSAEPYCHLCLSVGVLSLKIGHPSDWYGENGINRLNQIIYQIDRLLETYLGLEKVRSTHCVYTAAVGVLPEITRNIHDTPFTIGDLLASLTNFAINAKQMVEDEGLEASIGIDCGNALSVVIGVDRPRYDIIGIPCKGAIQLMENASQYGIIVSEEIYLALRPRNFNFDHNHSVNVGPGLIGYVFSDALALKQRNQGISQDVHKVQSEKSFDDSESAIHLHEETTQCTSVPMDQSSLSCPPPHDPQHFIPSIPANATTIGFTAHNPLEMFTSMNSSMSSEMYSIDISVESDSEIEWITPESVIYEKLQGKQTLSTSNDNSTKSSHESLGPSTSIAYKSDRVKQYSNFSENNRELPFNFSGKMKRRRLKPSLSRNGPRVPNWLSSKNSVNSALQSREGSVTALERLNAAAQRVDRMLQELAHVGGIESCNGNFENPFPTSFAGLNASSRSINIDNRRELSSACHTEYDNAGSEGACSDPEMVTSTKLVELKHALRGYKNREKFQDDKKKGSVEKFFQRKFRRPYDNGNEADVDSNCSSVASSTMLDKLRWKSIHSIGYENEYEFASDCDEQQAVNSKLLPALRREPKTKSVGDDANFIPMDASDSESEHLPTTILSEVTALTQDIYKNFGEYQLSTFSDMDASG
jgi:hypothetical protein